jgi:cyanophycinase
MILGGESYEALRGEAEKSSDILRYKRPDRPGFGMFPFGVIDTHCSARGREGRMAVLAAATGRRLAFGVGEDTALVVGRTGGSRASMRVVGQNGVSVVDLSSAASRQHDGRWTIRDLRFSYLTSGDRLTLKKRPSTWSVDSLSVAAGKPRVVPHRSGRTPTTNDIFSSYRNRGPEGRRRPRQLVKAARVLFGYRGSSLVAGAFEDRGASARPILNVKLSKDARSRAYGGIRGRSVVNLRVDMTWKKKR